MTANVPKLTPVEKDKPRRHRWGDGILVGEQLDRTERTCALCGLVKVTVHPPQGWPWREWRTRDGSRWEGENTPPCVDGEGPS